MANRPINVTLSSTIVIIFLVVTLTTQATYTAVNFTPAKTTSTSRTIR